MKTIEEMIAVMQAFVDGKRVERQSVITPDEGWFAVIEPAWNWNDYDYRVKPEPPKKKIVPYDSAEELMQAICNHGAWIKYSDGCYAQIVEVESESDCVRVYFGGTTNDDDEDVKPKTWFYTLDVLRNCNWIDGHVCGKEVDE